MNIPHEAGETARKLITALPPAVLALVLLNLAFMGVVTYVQHTNGERWQALVELTLKQCGAHQ
jgi:hypothetical protein